MWIMEELTQICKDMLLEGNLHNIIVFTVITSSSVLSVVGVLKHIYTFVHNLRCGQQDETPGIRPVGSKHENEQHGSLDDSPIIASFDRLKFLNCEAMNHNLKLNRPKKERTSCNARHSESSTTCLKCETGVWERQCVYGLCKLCCERLGGCQGHLHHQRQPVTYDPWPNGWHKQTRIIDLSHLYLEELPPRLGFHHMDAGSLNVSYNCLSHIPQHVTLMRGLVSISLQHNLISHIPTFFASLHQLSYVDLRNNKLTTFPQPFLDLPQLVKLYLDHNHIKELPCDIDKMHFLQCLSLGHNKLTSIPDTLFNIQSLKSLTLRGNAEMSVLPSTVGNLVCLQRLDVSRCDLRLVPSTLSSCSILRKCNISNNRLTHLPCEISQCYRLEYLDVSNNRLTYLPATLLFRQGILTLIACGNNFMSRDDPNSQWSLLDSWRGEGQRQAPTLQSLAGAVVEMYGLDPSVLPLPVQDELSSISSCYHCGRKKVTNGIRAVQFSSFALHDAQWPPQPRQYRQEYPFLYTFCRKHLQGCTQDSVETFLETLSHLNESLKSV